LLHKLPYPQLDSQQANQKASLFSFADKLDDDETLEEDTQEDDR